MRHAWAFILIWFLSLPAWAAPLIIGTTEKWEGVVPFKQTPGDHHYAREFVAPPVVALNAAWEWVCRVCVEIPSEKKGTLKIQTIKSKGKRLVTDWEIPQAMTWANGRPVTGYDVEYTFQHMKSELTNKIARQVFPVEKVLVDPQNPRRFTVTFRQVRADFAQVMAVSLLPSYLKQLNAEPTDPAKATKKVTPDDHDIASPYFYYGPYQVKATFNHRLELVRNPHYSKKAGIEEIHIVNLETSPYLLSQLIAGEVHMAADGALNLAEVARFKETLEKDAGLRERLKLLVKESLELEHVVVNLRNPMLSDSSVRKALLMAIDRDKLNEQVYKGLATPANMLLNPNDPFYAKALREHAYNPEESNKLLTEVGWVLEEGEKVRTKDGERLHLTLITTENESRRRVYEFIKNAWEKIGVELAYEAQADEYFQDRTLRRAKFRDMALYSWTQAPGSIFWSTLHSRNIPAEDNGYDGENTAGWFKNEVNKILDELVTQFDPEEQKKLTAALMKHYVLDLPTLPLFFKPTSAVVPTKLNGFILPAHLYDSGLYVDQWKM